MAEPGSKPQSVWLPSTQSRTKYQSCGSVVGSYTAWAEEERQAKYDMSPGGKPQVPSNKQNWGNKDLAPRVTFLLLAYLQARTLEPLTFHTTGYAVQTPTFHIAEHVVHTLPDLSSLARLHSCGTPPWRRNRQGVGGRE